MFYIIVLSYVLYPNIYAKSITARKKLSGELFSCGIYFFAVYAENFALRFAQNKKVACEIKMRKYALKTQKPHFRCGF